MSRPSGRSDLTLRHDVGWAVDVAHRGRRLLTYVYAPDDVQLESPRPYLHPVRTLGGELVTAFRPWDHVWHKGIAWSLPNLGEHNFWGGPTYVRDEGYRQLDNDGSMDHERFTALEADGDGARIAHELTWHTQPDGTAGTAGAGAVGHAVVSERRELRVVVPADDAWVLTFATTMTNIGGTDLDIGSPTTNGRENAGYGGLFWRGPRSFTGGSILAPGVVGGEEVRGTRAEWMGFSGRHDGTGTASSVVMVDDAANPQHPPQWFMRTEMFACANPAPFFSEEVAFPAGGELSFRYAVVIADGAADADRGERLAALGRAALER
ncbi:PmoA family protein [Actinotalea ferrariae]|uniref:DUF6807 domain-containing protein n=1 Tax=Actinotalea ferrariae TaxID=1386098 RepID=UPI001C8C5CA9|nr:PmoA family protein [Actinotalea ferrariae]MBX9243689.1 PmoA family protein [Actinotalea ferrariae]